LALKTTDASEVTSSSAVQEHAATATLRFHHVAVQTNDLQQSLAWYEDFLGCRPVWSLADFSELTRSRLPGIRRLNEIVVGDVRLHVFERKGRSAPAPRESVTQFQHLCMKVEKPEELVQLRERWLELYESGRYTFAYDDPPSEVVVDEDGVQSFYALDVNGLEFEFTFVPEAA
jgi:catechol 2,3-dioxygenase-like lactoylglutathione lyase family enzyme